MSPHQVLPCKAPRRSEQDPLPHSAPQQKSSLLGRSKGINVRKGPGIQAVKEPPLRSTPTMSRPVDLHARIHLKCVRSLGQKPPSPLIADFPTPSDRHIEPHNGTRPNVLAEACRSIHERKIRSRDLQLPIEDSRQGEARGEVLQWPDAIHARATLGPTKTTRINLDPPLRRLQPHAGTKLEGTATDLHWFARMHPWSGNKKRLPPLVGERRRLNISLFEAQRKMPTFLRTLNITSRTTPTPDWLVSRTRTARMV